MQNIKQLEIKRLSLRGQLLRAKEDIEGKKHFDSLQTMTTYMNAVGAIKRTALEPI